MDRNKLLIGGAIIVIGGAIATGVILNNFDSSSSGKKLDDNLSQEIEEQNFRDFADEDRYSFCQSREEIKGPYTSSVFSKETGEIEYISEDINVLDKEKNKLFILGRKINYKYSGTGQMSNSAGGGKTEIKENGLTIEYYSKFNAPIRIDYGARLIYPAPERKTTDWVVIETTGRGTAMGFTQERVDKEMGDAKTFCPPFLFKNALITTDYLSFEKSCDNGPGGSFRFSGNFKFECGKIDNERGIEIVKEYKQQKETRKMLESSINTDVDGRDEFQDLIKRGSEDRDTQKKLQQMRDELKGDGIKSAQ
jgi:hypothetical protein